MEMALRKALEKDEFTLAFQPVVDAASKSLVGFEALLRWYNPEFGQVSPSKFIPLAEDARLVVPIGNWVLHRACREAVSWPANVRVAVNVSAEQLYEPDFVDTVVEALSETGLPPQRLELEVTESVFLREGSRAGETLDRILALGVGLSLDDFGTGYSALGYLSKTRFTTIKVDRSFVQGAARGTAREHRDHPRGGGDGGQPGHVDDCRRRRNRARSEGHPRPGLQEDPGLFLRSPDGRRGCRRAVHRLPLGQLRLIGTARLIRSQARSSTDCGQRLEQPCAIGAAMLRFDHAFGVRHHAQHIALCVEYAGDIAR